MIDNPIKQHPSFGAFKAYDIRGRVPSELNPELYYRIGGAYASILQPSHVAVGHDVRLSSPELSESLIHGLLDQGVNVTDLGLCGTEEIYFAAGQRGFDGGLMVTASHNPADYNGLKMVGAFAQPLPQEIRLAIKGITIGGIDIHKHSHPGQLSKLDIHRSFIGYTLNLVNLRKMPHLKVVCNPGNGNAGVVLERLEEFLPIDMIIINGEPDGNFPNGVPNPLLPECRESTSQAVLEHHADLGVAWDGDFDRCFFFDENGRFIEGYYVVGILAKRFLNRYPGASIIHDPRLTWNTQEIVTEANGKPIESQTGHVYIKQSMRDNKAIYGGEMSSHHYFRDFFYCDSGILPWLFIMELMGMTGQPLSTFVDEMITKHPISGEINRRTTEKLKYILDRLKHNIAKKYGEPLHENTIDGLSWEYPKFRFNVRASNTEPLVRLNVETRQDTDLLHRVTEDLLNEIGGE